MTLNLASFQTILEWTLNGTIPSGTLQMLYLCGHFWIPEFFQHIFTASNKRLETWFCSIQQEYLSSLEWSNIFTWVFPKIGVPIINHPLKNRVFHYFHHPFWGTPIFGNTHIQHIYIHPKPSFTTHRRLESSHDEADPPDRGLGFWICLKKIKNQLIFSKHLVNKHKNSSSLDGGWISWITWITWSPEVQWFPRTVLSPKGLTLETMPRRGFSGQIDQVHIHLKLWQWLKIQNLNLWFSFGSSCSFKNLPGICSMCFFLSFVGVFNM